jgi:AraC-like DNA-binding protein
MLRVSRLSESALVRIDRVDHPLDVPHVDPDEEVSEQYSINFLEHGHFSIVHEARTYRVGSTELLLTAPGQVHRYVHDHDADPPTDRCVALCFTGAAATDPSERIGPLRSHGPVVPLNNRRAYLRDRLFAHLAVAADPMALDVIAGELLDAISDRAERPLYRPGQLAWYAKRVDAARRLLDEDFSANHTLAGLASDAGMSPFHFARVFRELAGAPPHRYLLRRRMSAAADMLRDGTSVTDACFAVGFRSLSHFVRSFHLSFGVPPSRYRRPHDRSSSP